MRAELGVAGAGAILCKSTHLVTEVLRGDGKDAHAQRGLLQLRLQAVQLAGLLLAAFPQQRDERPVHFLRRPAPPAHCSNAGWTIGFTCQATDS